MGLPGAAQARPEEVGGGRAEPLQVVPGGRRYRHGEGTSRHLLPVIYNIAYMSDADANILACDGSEAC